MLPPALRCACIARLDWVDYPRASLALDQLHEALAWPPHHRKPCLFLAAPSQNGKTSILRRFMETLPADIATQVVKADLAAGDGAHGLDKAILTALGLPLRRTSFNTDFTTDALKIANARMVIIDRMEHLCDRPRREQLVLMSQIKIYYDPASDTHRSRRRA
jgi:hypothetical protein